MTKDKNDNMTKGLRSNKIKQHRQFASETCVVD